MIADALFNTVRREAAAAEWSRGVELTRRGSISGESEPLEGEVTLFVADPKDPVVRRVTLGLEDESWSSDCVCNADPCAHVAAALIALRQGLVKAAEKQERAELEYHFGVQNGSLVVTRMIQAPGSRRPLEVALTDYLGGTRSGRRAGPDLAATREDLLIDDLLRKASVPPERPHLERLLELLRGSSRLFLGDEPVQVAEGTAKIEALLTDEGDGIRLTHRYSCGAGTPFRNGAVHADGLLYVLSETRLSREVRELLTPPGKLFPAADFGRLRGELIPRLERELRVRVETRRLPELQELQADVLFETQQVDGALVVTPRMVYGNPPAAELQGEVLRNLRAGVAVRRDIARERLLSRELLEEYGLSVGTSRWYRGGEGVKALRALRGRQLSGDGVRAFDVEGPLTPRLDVSLSDFSCDFAAGAGDRVTFAEADQAFRRGQQFVRSAQGRWYELPTTWLAVYARHIERYLHLRAADGGIPAAFAPALQALAAELQTPLGADVERVLTALQLGDAGGEEPFPADLQVTLRDYQRAGVRWLASRLNLELGCLLADDMGLGKTIQALTIVRGRTLVVCPTSVLVSWREQLRRFRPSLSVSLYHGTGRELNEVDVTLTSYAVLRRDVERLEAVSWETVILDETQQIKNPDSQVSRAAFRLRTKRRVALTGTPIENSVENLWSQFRFINPGLLGSAEEFERRFAGPIRAGDARAAADLQALAQPFILRRTKEHVAPELPPKTERIVFAELREKEREVYQSLLAASTREVRDLLERGGSVLTIFESLLRARQSCCHLGLVPGFEEARGSAKLELLREELQPVLEAGHKALIFSQWTSLLDRVEGVLKELNCSYLRLDGSTRDRESVVSGFQRADGPPVLLLSLRAGGVGITLTAAEYVYLLDPWWNPAVERQAADRAHRIGQEKPVIVTRLVAANTIEEGILELQRKKSELAEGVLAGATGEMRMTADDFRELLALS